MMNDSEIKVRKIILFDGVCNLCNSSVLFVLKRERSPIFQFASIQSETGKELLRWCGLPPGYAEAVLLIDNGTKYSGFTAALRIGRTLKFPWSVLSLAGYLFPKFIRDWVYRLIAKHRYRWFGKRDVCLLPNEELRSRFLG